MFHGRETASRGPAPVRGRSHSVSPRLASKPLLLSEPAAPPVLAPGLGLLPTGLRRERLSCRRAPTKSIAASGSPLDPNFHWSPSPNLPHTPPALEGKSGLCLDEHSVSAQDELVERMGASRFPFPTNVRVKNGRIMPARCTVRKRATSVVGAGEPSNVSVKRENTNVYEHMNILLLES